MMRATRTLESSWAPGVQTRQFKKAISPPIDSGSDCFQRTLFAGKDNMVKRGAPPIEALLEPQYRRLDPIPDGGKLTLAKDLGRWMEEFLRHRKVEVAVVSRQGSEFAKLFDQTGMSHSGIAVYDQKNQRYEIYNLINHERGNPPRGIMPQAAVWKSTPVDFFYEQLGHTRDALIMIPSAELQQKMRQGIESGEYKKLYFTRDYNLVSAPHTTRSLNCTKWILMNLVGADMNNYDPAAVLDVIKKDFKPAVVDVHPVFRSVIKRKSPFILPDEISRWEPIHSVSVASLYHSKWFHPDNRTFYNLNNRTLLPNPPKDRLRLLKLASVALGKGLRRMPIA